MEKQVITIYDVAREADVSMATVSRVVNGNPNVKPATRKKVLEVIERLDYRPNAVARGLASKRTTTVGVIIPDITNLYFSSLARGIDDIATMYKYNIILANSDENPQKEIQVLNALLAKQVDGIIYMGNHVSEELQREFEMMRTPVVLAGTVDAQERFASVNIDYIEAVREAVASLAQSGNKRIAFVTTNLSDAINGEYRLQGYKEALKAAKLKYNDSLVITADNTYKSGEKIVAQLKDAKADAVFVTSDELAVGVLNAAVDAGYRVPKELEIMTANNSKLTRLTRPELSTITPPLYDIGAVAMRLLTKIMDKEDIAERTILLPYKLTTRGTTK